MTVSSPLASPRPQSTMAPPSGGQGPFGHDPVPKNEEGWLSGHIPPAPAPTHSLGGRHAANRSLLMKYEEYLATLREAGVFSDDAEVKKMAFEYAMKDDAEEKARVGARF